MKRLIGLILFCVGAGMVLMMILPVRLSVLIFTAALLIIGYNLFCSC